MKKLYVFILLLAVCKPFSMLHAQYPANFSWLQTYGQRDQQIAAGPCNYFASVAAMEAWYEMLYGVTPSLNMSEQHVYSPCVATGLGTMLNAGLQFLVDSGVVNESDIPYANPYTDSHPYPGPSADNFADKIGGTHVYHCFAPLKAAATPSSRPDDIYFAGGYQLLNFSTTYSTITNTVDRLKRMLLNYGPLVLNLTSTLAAFHTPTAHAYLLYGWSTSGTQVTWLFKDSWPGTHASTTYTGNFINVIGSTFSVNSGPYALVPSKNAGVIVNEAVYDKKYTGGWTKTALTKVPINPANLENNQSNLGISINGQPSGTSFQYISGTQATLSIENISQFDNYSVQWTYTTEPLWPGTSVTYTAPTSANTNIYNSGADGYVTIKATVTLSNGVQFVIGRRVFTNSGIPFKLVKTQDACFSGVRTIKYEIQSKSGDPLPSSIVITSPWSLTPSTGTTAYQYYSTGLLPNSILLINFYPPGGGYGSYGLQVTLHDPGYSNIVDMSTTGGSVAPCGAHFMAKTAPVSVWPNPARTQVTVAAPANKTGETYSMIMTDVSGHVLLRKRVTGNTNIDVSRYAKGVYILQFISSDKKQQPVVQKVVVD